MNSPEENTSTRIVSLISENFKRLRAVHIKPDGNMVRIVGKNGAGKSSVLDSIASALGGGDAIPTDPIRHGAKKARVILELEDLTVTRTFTKSGSTLVIEGRDGQPKKSPQELLNRLTGKVTFDPLLFLSLDPKKKLETLRALVGIDTTAIDAARLKAFNERTLVNRDLEQSKALVARLPFHKDAPAAEESSASVLSELTAAQEHNKGVESLNKARDDAQKAVDDAQAKHESLIMERAGIQDNIRQLQADLAAKEKESDNQAGVTTTARGALSAAKRAADAAQKKDTSIFSTKLSGLESTNAQVRANRQYNAAQLAVREKAVQADALSRKIADADEKKQALLESVKFPVAGLALDEDGVSFNGVPIEQASDAEKLRVSVAIAAAMNPKLKIMLARNASLLDEDSLKLLDELAEKYGLQIWMEIVGTDSKTGIVIEDGHIAGEEAPPESEPATAPDAPAVEQQDELSIPPSK